MAWLASLALSLALICNECNTTTWELHYQGEKIIGGEMETLEECEAAKAEIDKQTPAFTELECVEVPAIRHES